MLGFGSYLGLKTELFLITVNELISSSTSHPCPHQSTKTLKIYYQLKYHKLHLS